MSQPPHVLPYLTQFASPRISADSIDGWYSRETAMWMIETATGVRPAIEQNSSILEMATKTAVRPESDDVALELLTKTDVQQEQDDEDPPSGFRFY